MRPPRHRVLTVGLLVLVMLAGAGPAVGSTGPVPALAAVPEPTQQAPWPQPGAGTTSTAGPVPVTGQVLSVRALHQPLVLIEQDVEKSPGTSFTVNTSVLFATGQSVLTPASDAALRDLAQQITEAGLQGRAAVVGHTDNVGSPATNRALSTARARAVRQRLTSLLTAGTITLTADGRGESDPLVPNSSTVNRARNRRVSVVFASAAKAPADATDIAVPVNASAPVAGPVGAPAGSLVGTQRMIDAGRSGRWQIRMDVTGIVAVGDMLMIETTTQLLASQEDRFSWYEGLFTGGLFRSGQYRVAVYDRAAGHLLPLVIDGKGKQMSSPFRGALEQGTSKTSWLLVAQPRAGLTAPIELYVPAFGVLTIPVKR